jgi:cytochrome c oxidase assembly protein subunit 15
MVEWKPHRWGYPGDEKAWKDEFTTYQGFPEFKSKPDMTLEEFKEIYFIEWAHRTYAKGLGLYFALPLAFFWRSGALVPAAKRTLGMALGLGAFQGFVGWWMVKSGLEKPQGDTENVRVRHTRLAIHQGLGLSLYSLVFWGALTQLRPDTSKVITSLALLKQSSLLRSRYMLGIHLAAGTLLTGALVAGTDAGKVLTNWPWYGDRKMFPQGAFDKDTLLENFRDNREMIQYCHRTLDYLTALTIYDLWRVSTSLQVGRTVARVSMIAVTMQVLLGIGSLYRAAPLPESLSHQGNAIVLLSCLLMGLHGLRRPPGFRSLV